MLIRNNQATDLNAYEICMQLRAADLNAYRMRKPLTVWYRVPQISPAPVTRIISHFTTFLVISEKFCCGDIHTAIERSLEDVIMSFMNGF